MPLLNTFSVATSRAFKSSKYFAPPGQVAYTTLGTYSWTCPAGVYSVCVVAAGGSGGGNASYYGQSITNIYSRSNLSTPGLYGGGGASSDLSSVEITNGAQGAVRIIWGEGRAFPATNTGNV